jgi:hypothetical protein
VARKRTAEGLFVDDQEQLEDNSEPGLGNDDAPDGAPPWKRQHQAQGTMEEGEAAPDSSNGPHPGVRIVGEVSPRCAFV